MTPEDVDETFRRIARRRTSRATTVVASRASGLSGRPVLRRGPQRSTRDAITALGNIPILNPSPQKAVYTSVDEDIDDHEAQAEEAPSVNHVDSVHGTSPPVQSGQAASVLTATSSVLRSMHLPFRLRHRRTSNSESTPDEQIAEASPQPPADSSDNAALDPATTASPNNANAGSSDSRLGLISNSPAELRGGGRPSRRRTQGSAGDASRTPPPLHQMERPRSPQAQEPSPPAVDSQESPPDNQPTLYLEGYWKDPLMSPVDIHYHFREMMPRTEPRRRSGRQPTPMRSLSSGSAPAYAAPTQRQDASRAYPVMFGNVPAPDPPTRPPRAPSQWAYESSSDLNTTYAYPPSVEPGMLRWRQFSSAASNASGAFSYYGSDLPDSRHPSREQSGLDQLSQSQYDGAVASRHVSRSSHRPPRQLEVGASGILRPPSSRGSSQSSPNLASSIQHGISPLPSMPYTRVHSVQSSLQPQPSTGFVASDSTAGNYVDAATAAAQDIRSPLDDYSEQYQRSLRAQHARQTMPAQPSTYQHELDGVNTFRSHQGIDSHYHNRVYRSPWTNIPPMAPPVLPSTHGSHEHSYIPTQSYQRTRTDQGSSENIPVNPTSNEARSARRGRTTAQTAAYEQVQGAGQVTQAALLGLSRPNIPPPATRDMSNRPRRQAPPHQFAPRRRSDAISRTSPHPFLNPRQPPQSQFPSEAIDPRLTPIRLPSVHPRQRLPSTSQSQRIHPRLPFRQPSTLHLDPARDVPSTSLALDHGSGTTSRHSRSPTVRTGTSTRMRPRIPAHQRDQENSGEGERALMRREEGAINARYGAEEQREVMDETPPRVGRVERRMFE